MPRNLRFEFNADKLIHALAFFAVRNVPDFTKLKAAKLLFFADKIHLVRFGRPILGDCYVSMDKGPVPSQALNVMNDLLNPDEGEDPIRERARDVLHIRRHFVQYPRFQARGHRLNLEVFSDSERDVLEEVAREFGPKDVGQLIELTHREPAWVRSNECRTPSSSAPMFYEWFWEGLSDEERNTRAVAEAEQEDRDFLAALQH